jgi:hypothetical protein
MLGRKLNDEGQVLVAEMRDVRPFARLLRGIGIKHVRLACLTSKERECTDDQQATVVISKAGFEISVEEVRTLCGKSPSSKPLSFPSLLTIQQQLGSLQHSLIPSHTAHHLPKMLQAKRNLRKNLPALRYRSTLYYNA